MIERGHGNPRRVVADVRFVTTPQPPYGHQPQPPQQSGYRQPYPPQQAYQYPPNPHSQHPTNMPTYLPPSKPKRKKWPWIVGALVLVPILMVGGCMALLGGAVSAVDQARKGGTVNLGEAYTYASGVKVSASVPKQDNPGNQFIVAKDEQGFVSTVTVTNGTDKAVAAALVSINATVNGAPAERYFADANLPTQDIAPGQSLAIPFKFKMKKGTSGPLQIAVTADFNEPVFFNGQMG